MILVFDIESVEKLPNDYGPTIREMQQVGFTVGILSNRYDYYRQDMKIWRSMNLPEPDFYICRDKTELKLSDSVFKKRISASMPVTFIE